MGVNELDFELFYTVARECRRRPPIALRWEATRIERLRAKAGNEHLAAFERACARGQLAAVACDLEEAEKELLSTLRQFKHLYPANSHLFTHILQLALAMQALDLVALFLNDRYKTPDLFLVAFGQATKDPTINVVMVDEGGRCHLAIDPRIPGAEDADYLVGRSVSSAPIWASYCRSPGWEPGKILVNWGEAGGAPGLAYCGNKPEHILVPDHLFLDSQVYRDLRAKCDAARISWDSRLPIAFWRGATTGIRIGDKTWETLPRIRLCQLAIQNPHVLDAGISTVVQTVYESEQQHIEAAGLMRGRVPEEEFLKYKYQIDIDGNSNAWKGLYQKLLTGSPVLKVTSPHGFRQWYYDRLKPWSNYVPVESDMSDLVEKIEWLRKRDDFASIIGQTGLALARSLEFEQELRLTHNKIRAGFRRAAGKPELEFYFGSDRPENDVLTHGWDAPESARIWALGGHSVINLPRPIGAANYELRIDLEPNTHPPDVAGQKIVITANGVVVADRNIAEREIISCLISNEILQNSPLLTILILHPDGFAPCLYLPLHDDRDISIAIHSLSVIERTSAQSQASLERKSLMCPVEAAIEGTVAQTAQSQIMRTLYGRDVWCGYIVAHATEDSVQGWNGTHPSLRRLLLAAPKKIFIDVGVWKGQSTIYVAKVIRELALDGCVISIDTWLGSVEHWGLEGRLFDRRMGLPNLYETFCSNIISHGVSDLVVPLPQTARSAAQILRQRHITAGVIHVDASHEYEEVLSDLHDYWPVVTPGGYLAGDDYHPTWPGVVRAADEFAKEIGLPLEIAGPKFILQKAT